VHSGNCRPVHHGLQHQSRPRGEADAEIFPGPVSSSGMRGTGTDSHDDGQDGCENSKTAHRSILWRTIRRLCHGSSSKLSEVNKSTQRAKWDEPQPARNQQIHRACKNRTVRFRSDLFRSGQWRVPQVLNLGAPSRRDVGGFAAKGVKPLQPKKQPNSNIPKRKTQNQLGRVLPPKLLN
jgi:hypothetical protein